MNKLDLETKNIIDDNIDKIGSIFPNVIVETENGQSIDFDLLKQELSSVLIEGNQEKYQFTWAGKRESIVTANSPIVKTLRPIRNKSKDYDNTENIYIEGDNLEVLKILQESYLNKIKCIYIDPPYNTGNDFIYNDNFFIKKDEELEKTGQSDEYGNRLISNSQSNGKYHSDWLSMMYPRLKLARNLLTEDGVIFISIDDNEVDNLKKMCDEIFGERNRVSQSIRRTINSGKHDSTTIAPFHEYLLIYCKDLNKLKLNKKLKSEEDREKLYNNEDDFLNERGRFYITQLNKNSIQYSDSLNYPIVGPDGEEIWPGTGFDDKKWCWRWGRKKLEWGIENNFIVFKKQNDKYKVYTKSYEFMDNDGNKVERNNPYSSLEFIDKQYANFNATPELVKLFDGEKFFDFPKPTLFIKELLFMANDKNGIFLDFYSGSGTTAHACMQINAEDKGNRKFIMVQLPELCNDKSNAFKHGYNTICEIGQDRIRRAGEKIKEETNADIDYGFRVYKVDSSNMTDVYHQPNDLKQTELRLFEENIKEDRTSEDLLTQVILDLGLTLDLKIESKNINNNNVYFVAENSLIACFDNNININMIDEIVKYNPLKVVFRDSSFGSDNDRINVEEKFKKYSPETEVSII